LGGIYVCGGGERNVVFNMLKTLKADNGFMSFNKLVLATRPFIPTFRLWYCILGSKRIEAGAWSERKC